MFNAAGRMQGLVKAPIVADPYFSNVWALLHFDGVPGATTTTDVKGHTVTLSGPTAALNATARFGATSVRLNGNGNDACVLALPALGTADFTIEMWVQFVNIVSGANGNTVFDARPTSTNGAYPAVNIIAGQGWNYLVNGSNVITQTGNAPVTGAWYHVAVCRASGATRLFVNGVQAGSSWADTTSYLATNMVLAYNAYTTSAAGNGFWDEMRITPGIARYTAPFTPPTAAFPNS